MAVHALDNTSWGFASNCFVCEPSNEGGLRVPFFHDDEAGTVYAEYTLPETFSGAPSYVHGGVTMALLDEAMSWATIAEAKAFALTTRTTTEFKWPIRIGRTYRVEARIAGRNDATIEVTATVSDAQGRPCAVAESTFHAMDADQAKSAIGVEVSGDDAGYVQG